MKKMVLIFLVLIGAISINSCSESNEQPSGTFTVNLVDGSTNQTLPNIQGASWGPRFRHDIALQTSNWGSNVQLNGGKLRINMAESHGKIRAIELYGPLSSELDPNSAFSQKYYSQGDLYFDLYYGLERTQVYYTKAKIKCIVNVTKPENVGKEFNILLIQPTDQKVSIKQGLNLVYTIKPLVLGIQYLNIDAIGNYKNQIKWGLNNTTLPDNPIEIFCSEGETKELSINL